MLTSPIIVVIYIFFSTTNANFQYYWRPWEGPIPSDAVPAGYRKDGEVTYVGLTFFQEFNLLIPSTIFGNKQIAEGHVGNRRNVTKSFTQILCAPEKHWPQWYQIRLERKEEYKNCHLITAGTFDFSTALNIGRIKKGNVILTGKVFPHGHIYEGLEVWNDGNESGIKSFSILGYCSNGEPEQHESPEVWKTFSGEILLGAIPGGTDGTGRPTYIGRTLFPEYGTLLTNLKEGTNVATATGKYGLSTTMNTEILTVSSTTPEFYPVTLATLHELKDCNFVSIGGWVSLRQLLIGRKTVDGRKYLGQVNPRKGETDSGLEVLIKDSVRYYDEFEVLAYCDYKVKDFLDNYYWRDFFGVIPHSAVRGGTSSAGEVTYIGSTFFPGLSVLPSTIYRGNVVAYAVSNGQEVKSSENTKILCAHNLDKVMWRQVKIKDVNADMLEKCKFIQGGYEDGYPLWIGRVAKNERLCLGKVFPPERKQRPGLGVLCDGKLENGIEEFEILGFCWDGVNGLTSSNSTLL